METQAGTSDEINSREADQPGPSPMEVEKFSDTVQCAKPSISKLVAKKGENKINDDLPPTHVKQIRLSDLSVAGAGKRKAQEAELDIGLSESDEWLAQEVRSHHSTVLRYVKKEEWTTLMTSEALQRNTIKTGAETGKCGLCDFKGSLKRTRIHVKQHYVRYFCSCLYTSSSRETVRQHRTNHAKKGNHHSLYSVDSDSFRDFCKATGWTNPPTFTPCQPVKGQKENALPSADKIKSKKTRMARDTSTAQDSGLPTRMVREQPLANYRIPKRQTPAPLPPGERIRIVTYHLGKPDPTEGEERRLNSKLRTMRSDKADLEL